MRHQDALFSVICSTASIKGAKVEQKKIPPVSPFGKRLAYWTADLVTLVVESAGCFRGGVVEGLRNGRVSGSRKEQHACLTDPIDEQKC